MVWKLFLAVFQEKKLKDKELNRMFRRIFLSRASCKYYCLTANGSVV